MLGENLEDFLEATLSSSEGEWASTDTVAKYLGIKLHSAYVSVRKLSEMGFIKTKDKAAKIALTEIGLKLANAVTGKHDLIKRFLTNFLCVPEGVADEDAHHMEHIISDESLEKILQFFEFVEKDPDDFMKWFSKYKTFVCKVKV
ncbi:MAG: metal-dependent transcriptional regulator [Candidatus Eremiobacteraeota bacterium]|nr:metal-dependent transcriptional regulator [Candidatus Eremiobacteraeota bacterium]